MERFDSMIDIYMGIKSVLRIFVQHDGPRRDLRRLTAQHTLRNVL